MEWVETTGATLDEAKERALVALGIDSDDAEIEVLTDVKMGLFGRVRTEARVRARVRPALPRARVERRQPRRRPRESRAGDSGVAAPEGRGQGAMGAVGQEAAARALTPSEWPPSPLAITGKDAVDDMGVAFEQGSQEDGSGDVEEASEAVRRFLEGLLDRLDMDGAVEVELSDSGGIIASVSGDGLGILVGPKGATLHAVQDLARAAMPRSGRAPGLRLTVDVAGYLARRSVALADFARKLAEEVRAGGVERHLEPMSASDRKTVHDTINGLDGVATRSEGEEPYRHVVIVRSTA
ncbi:MAG: Jag N-terminal domain-containing protein [Actinomycetota bacterium]|nr:Jag N-terminal domain-containing protein [Actinomycetota bacterium]